MKTFSRFHFDTNERAWTQITLQVLVVQSSLTRFRWFSSNIYLGLRIYSALYQIQMVNVGNFNQNQNQKAIKGIIAGKKYGSAEMAWI